MCEVQLFNSFLSFILNLFCYRKLFIMFTLTGINVYCTFDIFHFLVQVSPAKGEWDKSKTISFILLWIKQPSVLTNRNNKNRKKRRKRGFYKPFYTPVFLKPLKILICLGSFEMTGKEVPVCDVITQLISQLVLWREGAYPLLTI